MGEGRKEGHLLFIYETPTHLYQEPKADRILTPPTSSTSHI